MLSVSNVTMITTFFKQQKKTTANARQESENRNQNQTTNAEKFYQSCMHHTECKKTECIQLKAALNAQLCELKEKCTHHEQAVKLCTSIIDDKDIEIKRLKEILSMSTSESTPANESVAVESVSTEPVAVSVTNESKVPNSLRFSDFSNVFTSNQLAELRKIGLSAREDSSFVLAIMKFIYADRLTILKSKSVSGRAAKIDQPKEKITPEKENIIRKIFAERMLDINDDQRAKKLNKYIKDALGNITKSVEAKEKEKNIARCLEYSD